MKLQVLPPGWTPTNAEYHATVGRWSSSRLGLFRRSPWEAYQRHVLGTMPPEPASAAMDLGSALAQAITDPPAIGEHVYRADVKSRNTKEFKKAQASWPDRTVLTAPEYEQLEGMLHAFQNAPTPAAHRARVLLRDAAGFGEYGHRWEEEIGGVSLPLMFKSDRVLAEPYAEQVVMVELKSARDASPEGFARAAYNFGYRRQGAFYRRGLAQRLGCAPEQIAVFYVVIGSGWPHEVMVYPAHEERYLAIGAREVEHDLGRLAACLVSDNPEAAWRQPYEMETEMPRLVSPKWAQEPELLSREPAAIEEGNGQEEEQ